MQKATNKLSVDSRLRLMKHLNRMFTEPTQISSIKLKKRETNVMLWKIHKTKVNQI